MIGNIYAYIERGYEKSRAYKLNPCDYGAYRSLHLLRAGLAALSTDCRCCSGARIAGLAALATVLPWAPLGVIVAMMAYGVVKEIRDPQYNYGPESEE